MLSKYSVAFAASISSASAAIYQGFNYGAGTDFATEFALAKSLVGTSGAFTSARLYTTIEQNTANNPSSAIPAAIQQDVSLLLGIWGSGGQATVDNEIAALKAAIAQYGSQFTSRVVGISVGSEDLYRESPTGIEAMAGIGANPADIVNYINQVRSAVAGTGLSSVPVGHVDTWTAWVNGSNSAVVSACDWIGMDAYPYFQSTQDNSISAGPDLFFSAYQQTVSAGQGKPVWVTETGWPVSGPVSGAAQASTEDAEDYWQGVACKLLGETNTWWYTLNDAGASPSFGLTTGSSTPLYDLTCNATSSSSSSSSISSSTSASSSAASGAASKSASATSTATSTKDAGKSTVLAIGSSAAGKSSDAAKSTVAAVSSSAASLSAHESTATPSNLMVSVSSSAVASQAGGGSPGAKSSAAADSSAASLATASSSLYSSILASASSAAAASPTVAPTSVAGATMSASGSAAAATSAAASGTGSVAPFKGAASAVTMSSTGYLFAAIFVLFNMM